MASVKTGKGGGGLKPAPTSAPKTSGASKTVGGTSAPRDSASNTYTDGVRPKPVGGTNKGMK